MSRAGADLPGLVRRSRQMPQAVGLLIALVLVWALFALIAPPGFRTLATQETIARQSAVTGVAALGMTLIILAGGIDLSVGSIVALTSVVTAWLLQALLVGLPGRHAWLGFAGWENLAIVLSAAGAVAAGALAGLANGTLITRLRVVPFIVTLGMMQILRGAAKGLAHEQKIDAPLCWLNELLRALPKGRRWMLLPAGVWMLVVLGLLMWAVLRYTRFGRHARAIGSNEQTARLCGIGVARTKTLIYMLGGLFAGLAGVLQFSRLNVGDPTVAIGLELDVIAAVVIGGGSLAGGEGSIPGTIVGALIMNVIRAGCSQMGLPAWVQEMVTGAIIILAVALDRLRHRSRE